MFAIVALSAIERLAHPGPKNSTNFPTTPLFLSIYVIVNTRSVAVVCGLKCPSSLKPTTSGKTIDIAYPSMTDSASIPPTPHPSTPKPLIIVV